MIYAPEMLDTLQAAAVTAWEGTVYRHMFGANPPALSNTTGARWNGPSLEAIYVSCERDTALAEAEFYISLKPLRPKAKRTLYTIKVSLSSVIDLSTPGLLAKLGVSDDALRDPDHSPCRLIGSAVNWLGHDGLLVPSARRDAGINLVIFQQDLSIEEFEVIKEEVIAPDQRT
jgi:RES domain-containing protein